MLERDKRYEDEGDQKEKPGKQSYLKSIRDEIDFLTLPYFVIGGHVKSISNGMKNDLVQFLRRNINNENMKNRIEPFGDLGKLHVLADFDRTFTKAFDNGEKRLSLIGVLREKGDFGNDYASRAQALCDYYQPIEKDVKLSREKKIPQMNEWWQKHMDLIVEKGLTKQKMKEVMNSYPLPFREGVAEFITGLNQKNVPIVIMSAGIGDLIEMQLERVGLLKPNIKIVSNYFEYDDAGKVMGCRKPMIHSMNKYETVLKDFPVFAEIKDRKDVLLIGDSLDDVGMVEGFDYERLVKVGFCNEKKMEMSKLFEQNYDMVICDDGDFGEINRLVGVFL